VKIFSENGHLALRFIFIVLPQAHNEIRDLPVLYDC